MNETTWLFVPGSRSDRFARASVSGADAVILDLEDAVGPTQKVEARTAARRWLVEGATAWVRINGVGTPWHDDDVAQLAGVAGFAGAVLPKAEDPERVTEVVARLGRPVVALVESAAGLAAATEIARVDGVERLAFGSVDYALDLGCAHTRTALTHARSALVVASRLAGVPSPIDGVTVDVRDPDSAADDAAHAKDLGFTGKLCIHPSQVGPVAAAFAVTAQQLYWAEEVLRADRFDGGASVTSTGELVDAPVVARARLLVERASRQGRPSGERR